MTDDVLIIGGGLAGLTAGVALADAGCRVRLLEQKLYLGGRCRSFVDPSTGCVVDNGQHLFMGCYHATRRFFERIGTLDRVRFQPHLSLEFLDRQGRSSSLVCPDLPAPWHLLAGTLRSDSFTAHQKLEILRLGMALQSSGSLNNGPSPMERLTIEQWLERLGQSGALRRDFWDLLAIAAMNEDPRLASAALFERVLRLALFRSPDDSRLGLAVTGLSDCYTQAACDYITARGGRVETSRNVTSFLIRHGRCEGVRLADGAIVPAQTVLSSVPSFQFAELVPGDLLRSEPFFERILALKPAPIISINLWFDRPLTEHDFIGLRGTTVQWLFNKGKILGGASRGSPGPEPAPEGYVSLVVSGAHDHISWSREELEARALEDLAAVLPQTRDAKLLHSLVIKERFATFSPRPEAEESRPEARTPLEGLYLAGDWTATGLPATIEGAVKSGYTAAEAVLSRDAARSAPRAAAPALSEGNGSSPRL